MFPLTHKSHKNGTRADDSMSIYRMHTKYLKKKRFDLQELKNQHTLLITILPNTRKNSCLNVEHRNIYPIKMMHSLAQSQAF